MKCSLLNNLLYVIIDVTIVSLVENRTSTCLMHDSSPDEINYRFTELCLKCRLVNEICAISHVQPVMKANQLASTIDRAGNKTNFTENRASKGFFFSQDSKETCSLIFVSHKKGVSVKHTIHANNTY